MTPIQRIPFGGPVERFPLSRATVSGGTVYVSGQVPIDPGTKTIVEGGIRAQTAAVLDNLEAVLHAAGTTLDAVLSVSVYLLDISDAGAFNEVYRSRVAEDQLPARTMVEVAGLPNPGFLIEIDAIAATGQDTSSEPAAAVAAGEAGSDGAEGAEVAAHRAVEAGLKSAVVGSDERVDLGLDPRAADELGTELARRIPAEVDVVVGWDSPADEVLAHVVARELGVPRVSAELDIGLISLSRALAPGVRAAIVGMGGYGSESFDALVTLVDSVGGSVAAVVGFADS